jgi:preprotein translocase subunit YajC
MQNNFASIPSLLFRFCYFLIIRPGVRRFSVNVVYHFRKYRLSIQEPYLKIIFIYVLSVLSFYLLFFPQRQTPEKAFAFIEFGSVVFIGNASFALI